VRRKLGGQKGFESVLRKSPVFSRDLIGRSYVELESIVADEITCMKQGHFRSENRGGPFYMRGQRRAGMGKVDREENVLNHLLFAWRAPFQQIARRRFNRQPGNEEEYDDPGYPLRA